MEMTSDAGQVLKRLTVLERFATLLDNEKANASTVGGLATAMDAKADRGEIPQPASHVPMSEATAAQTGAQVRYAREDHQHKRLTSTTYVTLDDGGIATVMFTRPFTNKPGVTMVETDVAANAQPLVMRVQSWVRANDAYVGCVIRGARAQALPTLSPVAGLLNAVVTGVNGVVMSLTGYNMFGGLASGASVSVIAVARSDLSGD